MKILRLLILAALACTSGCQGSGGSANGTVFGSTPSVKAVSGLIGSEQQKTFCQLLLSEPNERSRMDQEIAEQNKRYPLKPIDIQQKRNELFKKLMEDLYTVVGPSGNFTGWKGMLNVQDTMEKLPFNMPSKTPPKRAFVVEFVPDCFTESGAVFTLRTRNGPIEDTNIQPDSNIGKMLQEMDLSKNRFTVSGQFLWTPPPPKGGGSWVPPIDSRYRFFTDDVFREFNFQFVVRFTQISR